MPISLTDLDWPIRTERLEISLGTRDDLEATWEFRRLPEVARWVTWAPQTLEEYREKFLEPKRLDTMLVIRLDGVVIGDLMFQLQDVWAQGEVAERAKDKQVELGWIIHPAYAGKGYATEAARALLALAFETLGLHRAVALCFTDNEASWRLMERIGMRREAHNIGDSLHRDLGWLDGYVYAMLADEWG